jgi:hypothetical protein
MFRLVNGDLPRKLIVARMKAPRREGYFAYSISAEVLSASQGGEYAMMLGRNAWRALGSHFFPSR